jgi:uncharacterized alkaline shock family protein YloU
MKPEYNNANLGDVSINNEVIKNIALKAATDIQGIHRIRKKLINKIWASLIKKDFAGGTKLEFADNSELKITLKLMVDYGVNIPYVAGAVQDSVKKTVEYMTGLTVTEVVVKIVEIKTQKDITMKADSPPVENSPAKGEVI